MKHTISQNLKFQRTKKLNHQKKLRLGALYLGKLSYGRLNKQLLGRLKPFFFIKVLKCCKEIQWKIHTQSFLIQNAKHCKEVTLEGRKLNSSGQGTNNLQNCARKHSRVLGNAVVNSKDKSARQFNFIGIKDETSEKIQLKKKTFRGMLSKAKNQIPWITYSVS